MNEGGTTLNKIYAFGLRRFLFSFQTCLCGNSGLFIASFQLLTWSIAIQDSFAAGIYGELCANNMRLNMTSNTVLKYLSKHTEQPSFIIVLVLHLVEEATGIIYLCNQMDGDKSQTPSY